MAWTERLQLSSISLGGQILAATLVPRTREAFDEIWWHLNSDDLPFASISAS